MSIREAQRSIFSQLTTMRLHFCGVGGASRITRISYRRLGALFRPLIGQDGCSQASTSPTSDATLLKRWGLNRYSSSVKHNTAAQLPSRSPVKRKNRVTEVWSTPPMSRSMHLLSRNAIHSVTRTSKLHPPTSRMRRSLDGDPHSLVTTGNPMVCRTAGSPEYI